MFAVVNRTGLVWTIRKVSNLKLADIILIELQYVICRDIAIGLAKSEKRKATLDFVAFLKSSKGKSI